jgi:hypothetical protein
MLHEVVKKFSPMDGSFSVWFDNQHVKMLGFYRSGRSALVGR